ncbi:MAG: hypothetical protein JNK37_19860 [Verrucomicrobiales bacterium]|nr:hypothetical protein [Verrucomicrobiales bacterium]
MMRDFDDIDLDAEEDYEIRQRSRDEDYRKAYGEWVASLPPEERERLGELGLDRASVPGAGTGAPSRDLAESSMACCEPEEIVEAEPQPSTAPSLDEPDPERLHDLLRRLVGELIGQDNARLSLECLALVTGLSYCGDSMTEIAARHGVTRAAVSKRCVELSRALNLKPSRAMRSISARQSYRRARLKHLSTQV